MGLAIFDLDNTLLAGDSDYLWGQFLVEHGIVDAEHYERENLRYYREYQAGTLDIHSFLAFQLRSLAAHDMTTLHRWRDQYLREKIEPIILSKALVLIENHRRQGHTLLIITATNRFITGPIAERLGVANLLASEPAIHNGRYTGAVAGVPCFREGKVVRLEAWLSENSLTLGESWFYSDSHNDIPLLEKVTHPTAVDPDPQLIEHAQRNHWPVISLR
ncbi:MAG: HAD-IB family hydrolase [Proteobacteria bacterium]|nr:HAD-IB family hydrolase [Pseudomonadota bacterium]